ncbi:hypothetical protein [Streptomyces winkii]|uniref:hypothetical protein n=1 Tax=Streptomyces winkii TaxID=3051178 RepID=UPI0028D03C66|nr:hypothetical protein [Streptomyces sp. DSM 40971]
MELTAAHWIYLAGIVVIIGVMIARKNVVVPAVVATLVTAWVFTGSMVKGLTSVFSASLTAASELFSIFLIIALVTALLGALRAMGAERRMVKPFQALMRNGRIAFFALVGVTYVISLFFWPTPAVPLIGAILLPAAIRAGLPAIGGAAAIAVAGQGMALSSDYVIQVAPGLSAKAAGTSTGAVADRAMVLSLIIGAVAVALVYWRTRKTITAPSAENLTRWEETATGGLLEGEDQNLVVAEARTLAGDGGGTGTGPGASGAGSEGAAGAEGGASGAKEAVAATSSGGSAGAGGDSGEGGEGGEGGATKVLAPPAPPSSTGHDWAAEQPSVPSGPGEPVLRSKVFAALVPLAFLALVLYMLLGKFTSLVPPVEENDGAALVGGVALLLLLAATLALDGVQGLTTSAQHVVDGLVFAFRAMGVVVPIAGFFFIGNEEFAGEILGLGEGKPPALLFDLVASGQEYIPHNEFILSFAILLVGMITGLEGSGFSGLPLVGSLSGALGPASGVDPSTLAAVGQMGSVWTGGGVLIAWSSLLAVAGVARVPVQDLVRKCFMPVVIGLVVATAVSVVLY